MKPCPSLRGWTMQHWLLVNSPLSIGLLAVFLYQPRLCCASHWTLWMALGCTSKVVKRTWRSCICTAAVLECWWWMEGGVAVVEAAFLLLRRALNVFSAPACNFHVAQEQWNWANIQTIQIHIILLLSCTQQVPYSCLPDHVLHSYCSILS